MISAEHSASLARNKDKVAYEDVMGLIKYEAGPLPQIQVDYESEIKTVWVTIKPQPKPVFTCDMLASLHRVQTTISSLWGGQDKYRNSPVRFLAFRGRGPFFTLGGDLDFYLDCLAKGDHAGLHEYARLSTACAAWNASCLHGSVITLATVHNKALGGGIDAPRSCNVMIAERPATFCFPEIHFNHFPIASVSLLSRHVGARAARRMLETGEKYTAEEFAAMGGLDAVTPPGEGENWLRRYAKDALPSHSAKLSLFCAFNRQAGDLESELAPLGEMWAESLMRLTPLQIAKLQRIVQVQERMMLSAYSS